MRWLSVVVALCACGDDRPTGACEEGETRACYSGPPGTEGVGTCAPGIETCIGGTFSGTCIGDVVPFVEHCDGVDEDCNGEIDDAEGTGEGCTNADGCDGAMACSGAAIVCVGPQRNECDICDGVAVADLGTVCTGGPDNCSGLRVCNGAGDAAVCNAPAENICGLCGGPAVTDLDQSCTATTGCAGQRICNEDGDGSECSCNPKPGMCLANGNFRAVVAPGVGDLVITEIMQSPSGDDTKQEWFEVEVKANVDLNQLELDRVGDPLDPDLIESVNCIPVTAGTRLLIARSAVTADNGGLPAVDFTFTFSLVASPPNSNITLRVGATTIDQVTWATSGTPAQQLDPDTITAAANDDPANFCPATTSYNGGADLGTPGQANLQCPIVVPPGSCLDGQIVRTIVKPPAGQLVITEFMADPASPGDAVAEWFEITNLGPTSFDLNDLTAQSGTSSETLTSTLCLPVAPNGFALLARNSDPGTNGGLPTPDATYSFGLTNDDSSLTILDGVAILDAVSWATQPQSGRSRMLLGNQTTTTGNDSQTNFCNAPNDVAHDIDGGGVGTNFGTPKAANDCP